MVLQIGFYVLLVGPVIAGVLAFQAPPPVRTFARYYLLLAWLAYGAATGWCLWTSFQPLTGAGIGNGVFLIIAIPLGVVTLILLGVWRAALRHAYVQSLPPDQRRVEELVDIERGLEAARESLRSAESNLNSFWVSGKRRKQYELQASAARFTIHQLEKQKAERR